MKYLSAIVLVAIITAYSCKNSNEFTKVPNDELIELLKQQKIDFFKIKYKDHKGQPISDSLKSLMNSGKMAREFYRNSHGEITEIRLVDIQEKNIFHEIRIRELQSDPFRDIEYVHINCSDASGIYSRAFKRDQDVRQGKIDNIQLVDKLNRDSVFSVIDKCKWPKTKEEVVALWYIVQHGESEKMAYYYPKFKSMADSNLFDTKLLAKMEDRLLMNNGFPQIYGTQLAPPHSFHEIKDVRNVNKRRREVGLDSIEITARKYGFEFKVEDYLN